MHVKTFVGNSMTEAMEAVWKELGDHAVILSTKTRHQPGLFGLGQRKVFEVIAAVDDAPAAPRPTQKGMRDEGKSARPDLSGRRRVGELVNSTSSSTHQPTSPPTHQPTNSPTLAPDASALRAELSAMRQLLHNLWVQTRSEDVADFSLPAARWLQTLRAQQVESSLARQMVLDAQSEIRKTRAKGEIATFSPSAFPLSPFGGVDEAALRAALVQRLKRALNTGGPIVTNGRRRVVCLVGPTGDGKTTTLAKLAADFALVQKKSVALVTADTYRIAAVEQIKVYAELIGLPLHVASTPQEMKAAMEQCRKHNLVLIDTTGRSPKHDAHLEELKTLLDASRPDEVHLVMSAVRNTTDALESARRFDAAVGVDKILFTKLDEASQFGALVSVAERMNKPLSYVTTGQEVPEDIEIADSEKLANAILEGQNTPC